MQKSEIILAIGYLRVRCEILSVLRLNVLMKDFLNGLWNCIHVSPIWFYSSLWLTSPRNSFHESSKQRNGEVIFFKTHLATTTWNLIGNYKKQKQKCLGLLLKIEIIHVHKSKYAYLFSIFVSTPPVCTTAVGFLLWKVTYNRWWIIHVHTCWYQTGNKVELLFITGICYTYR